MHQIHNDRRSEMSKQTGISNRWTEYNASDRYVGQPTGKCRVIPAEKLREWAKASNAGGRARCAKCGESFAMYYMRFVKFTMFNKDWACVDCVKTHGLQVVER